MRIETDRLLLRPWKESDAESLYTIAKDPHIGPLAGWLPHANKDDSRQVIKGILTAPEIYCITLKGEGEIIGSVGLHFDEESVIGLADNDAEIGYWIAYQHWGNGYATEAVSALVDRAFSELHIQNLWCRYLPRNKKSKRVSEKLGFSFHHVAKERYWKELDQVVSERVSKLEIETWRKKKKAAK
ncbi:MAG: GNAT family N-acetyltransferase [Candidatus Enteromonas sp.]|jgi:RimJ/RimL family protein N-acetyltransferase|nr:GNAT family N-acetyltransferase [Bacilli bacterium]MEE3402264.1 GNAT family N-acetyltransferase [Candidatus Enteromonas sp.]MEE3442918.1 GNAT family N-acetyltransferase [Candidatus Enteromonas sp.]